MSVAAACEALVSEIEASAEKSTSSVYKLALALGQLYPDPATQAKATRKR